MKQKINPLVIFMLIFYFVGFPSVAAKSAGHIRKPAYAGSFYPADRSDLIQRIQQLAHQAKTTPVQPPAHTSLKILIMPHAGYIYSGLTAAHISLVLQKYQFDKVIILGPDHRVGFQGGAISDSMAYETPLGRIKLHDEASALRQRSNLFQAIPASDRLEHSLEVVLPFLQFYLKEFELIPIILGREDINRYADAIDPLLGQNTLLVVSSDLSHYLSYAEAVAKDQKTIQAILNLDDGKLSRLENAACGKIPIRIALNLARRHGWQPILLHYSNSGDTAGGRSRVVGYAAIAFYGGTTMQDPMESPQQLNNHQGQVLLKIARQTIAGRLGIKSVDVDSNELRDMAFQDRRGTFVTLTIDGQLRGCIGNLDATESLLAGVQRNAINAAFHDPRFNALDAEDFDKVDIEISILTEPQLLKYRNSKDLLNKLRVNVDGVILRKGQHSATFLPQVWDQLPHPKQFLSHLCVKAGLAADAWKKQDIDISTYQVQYFEEDK